jgi:uncharacterized protein YkwD
MEGLLSLLLAFNIATSSPVSQKLDTCLKLTAKNPIMRQINTIRAKNGVNVVCPSNDLQGKVNARVEYLYNTDDFSHDKFYEEYTDKETIGEDLARNYSENSVVNAWMNSPTHREIILDPEFNQIAVGKKGIYTVLWLRQK